MEQNWSTTKCEAYVIKLAISTFDFFLYSLLSSSSSIIIPLHIWTSISLTMQKYEGGRKKWKLFICAWIRRSWFKRLSWNAQLRKWLKKEQTTMMIPFLWTKHSVFIVPAYSFTFHHGASVRLITHIYFLVHTHHAIYNVTNKQPELF